MKTHFTKLILLALTLVAVGASHPASAKLEREKDPKDGAVSISTDVIRIDAKTQVVGICVLGVPKIEQVKIRRGEFSCLDI